MRRSALASLAVLTAAVSACSGSHSASTHPPTLSPSQTVSRSPVQGTAERCRLSDLRASFFYGGVSAGSSIGGVRVRNAGSRPCLLRGLVTVQGLDRRRHKLSALADWHNRTTAHVLLGAAPHGAYAQIVIAGEYRDDFKTDKSCSSAHEVQPAFWRVRLAKRIWVVANRPGVQACRADFTPVRVDRYLY